MRFRFLVPLALCFMMLVPIAGPAQATSVSNPKVAVLIDFGNGQIAWADVSVNSTMNAFNATQLAVEQNGMVMNSTMFSWGVLINWINGIGDNSSGGGYNSTTFEYWGFWTWNATSLQWESPFVGASGIPAESVTAIAWGYAPYGVDPLATPDHRYPWRSNRGDNFNTGNAEYVSPNNITPRWSSDLQNGAIDVPIVSGRGLAYVVTDGVQNQTSFAFETNSSIYCLNTTNGAVVWHKDIGSGYQLAAPLLYAGMVIVPSANGEIYAFDAITGANAWAAPFDMHSGTVFGPPSIIAYGGSLYVASATGKLFCLTSTGTQVWNATIGSAIYASSPAAKDARIYIGGKDGNVRAFDSLTGALLWNVSVGERITGSPELISTGLVVTYTNSSSLNTGGVALVSYSGHVLKYVETEAVSGSAAITHSGAAVATSTKLWLISESGQKLWNVSLGTIGAFSPSSPTAVNGTIFTVTDEANSRLIAVSESGQVYFDYLLSPAEYTWAAPSVADGVLYTASDNGRVYAFNLNVVAPSPSTNFTVTKHNLAATFATPKVPGSLFSYSWEFGDGAQATGLTASHTYAAAGTYPVKLTVTSPSGAQLNVTNSVTMHAFTAPGNFAAAAGTQKVTLTWTAPSDSGGSAIVGYKIYRAVLGGSPSLLATVSRSNLTYVDTTGTAGTNYTYYVVAVNGEGAGPASAVASATPQPAAATDNSALYVLVIVVVAAVIIAVVLLAIRGRKK
jgi:outer membrane protein assembly factor BamB